MCAISAISRRRGCLRARGEKLSGGTMCAVSCPLFIPVWRLKIRGAPRFNPEVIHAPSGLVPKNAAVSCNQDAPVRNRPLHRNLALWVISARNSDSGRVVGNPSVTRPNGQRRVRCGLSVIRAQSICPRQFSVWAGSSASWPGRYGAHIFAVDKYVTSPERPSTTLWDKSLELPDSNW
jgi:hypothetical protein